MAAAGGVTEGMCLTDARALLGDQPLHIAPHEPARDARKLQKLADWSLRFAPVVQPDGDDGLLLDVTGCGRIYGGQKRAVNRIAGAIARLGFSVQAAIASTVGAAWAVSHFPPRLKHHSDDRTLHAFIIPDDQLIEILAPLPLAALRLDESTVLALHEVAVDTIGDLLAIDRAELADRFDPSLLRRLDETFGHAFEPINPTDPVELPGVERRFDGPVKQLEAIQITVRGLLELLAADLQRCRLGVTLVQMNVERYDAPGISRMVSLSRPSADAHHLWTLFAPQVERLNLGHGVEMIRLVAAQTQLLGHDQDVIWPDDPTRRASPTDQAVGQMIDRMISRLGGDRVCRLSLGDTHVPEAAASFEPWDRQPRNSQARTSNVITADRPSLLNHRPQRVQVVCLSPDGPVVSMRYCDQHRAIVTSIGPERIAGRWWLLDGPSLASPQRDYFKVQDEQGVWWWLYRQTHTSQWFCHGVWA